MPPIDYEDIRATNAQWAEVASWGWEPEGNGWVKRGPCPRCGDKITKTLERVSFVLPASFNLAPDMVAESYAGASGKAALFPTVPHTVKVFCNCSTIHQDGHNGCGFYVFDVPGP